MFDSNRRKYPRANYPCHLTLWVEDKPQETILANTTNIGIGGLSVLLDQAVPVGTKIDIQVHFNNTTTAFRCNGKAVYSMKEGQKSYNVGIQFEPLSELKFAFLEGKISEIIAIEPKGKT